eukprot:9030021-Alexandrium_andersonii.AAC.1
MRPPSRTTSKLAFLSWPAFCRLRLARRSQSGGVHMAARLKMPQAPYQIRRRELFLHRVP